MNYKLKFLFDHNLVLNDDRVGPHSVEIDPTNHCPIQCSYCIWSEMRNRNLASLSENVFERLIDDLIKLRVSGIAFTGGGEPLRHPFTPKAIIKAKAGGISTGLFTSGVPLSDKMSSVIIPHLSWIRFNLSAPDRELYKQIHGVDLFDQVMENIANCVNSRNNENLKLKLGIGCILSPKLADIKMIGLLTELAAELNLDFIQFKHDLNETGRVEYENWWKSKVLPELQIVSQNNSSNIKIEYSERTYSRPSKSPCFIVKKMATIEADGTVCLCKLHRDKSSMVVGNINRRSFRDIWLSARRKKIITVLRQQGCGTYCAYKGFNEYVKTIQQSNNGSTENHVIGFETGIQKFGEDINFL